MRCPRFLPLVLVCLSFMPIACGDDGGTGPPPPSYFSSLWPNSDSSSWTFDYREYSAVESIVPALEGLESLSVDEIDYLDLEQRLSLDPPTPDTSEFVFQGSLRVALNGTIETPFAGVKQNLETTLAPIAKTAFDLSPGLLRRIYWARPDLRSKMVAMGLVSAKLDVRYAPSNVGPIFAFPDSSAFEKKEGWLGYYGALNADSSYTILKAPLTPGTFFRHQLVPDLVDDIWEYGWVLGKWPVVTPAGHFRDALGVVYLIDFGISRFINEQGDTVRTFRSYSLNSLDVVPGVGPVYQRGLDYLSPPIPELNITSGILFNEASLREYDIRQ